MPNLLTIGEVARRSGVASSALRFYEQRGLITSERSGSGHRRFPRPVLRRIAFIVFAQRIGLTLEEIGEELAKLPPHHAPTRRDWSRLSATWTSRIDERIAELERLKLGLTECIGCGCLSLDRCQLANPGDSCRPARARPALLDRRPAGGLTHAEREAGSSPHLAYADLFESQALETGAVEEP
jgi:MerR family redox-sensitive transcriptional activator SoxR